MKNVKLVGIGTIIFGAAALIAAVGSVVANLLTLRLGMKIYEPWDRITKKAEPLVDEFIDYGYEEARKYKENQNKKYDEDEED